MADQADDPRTLANAVRAACLATAVAAYEDAGLQGLCAAGRFERALDAIRELHLPEPAPAGCSDLPELATSRLLLRVPGPDDAVRCARYVSDNRDHLARWEPERSDDYFTSQLWRDEATRLRAHARAGTTWSFLILDRADPAGAVLGRATLSNVARGPFQAASLGYSLDHRAEGRGLMYEALVAVLEHTFGALELHRVQAAYMPGNQRSARILRRLGFLVEGYALAYLKLAGRWQDHVLTALNAERWHDGSRHR